MMGERGIATVGAVLVVGVVVVAGVIGSQLVQLLALRQQAAAAADLAALAGTRASAGGEPGCEAARTVAIANGAELAECQMDADVATVTARVEGPRWWGGSWASEQRARAAPLSYLSP